MGNLFSEEGMEGRRKGAKGLCVCVCVEFIKEVVGFWGYGYLKGRR